MKFSLIIFLSFSFFFLIQSLKANNSFPVFRLIQYEKKGQQFGSQVISLNSLSFKSIESCQDGVFKCFKGKIAIFMMNDLLDIDIDELATKGMANGILIILPDSNQSIPLKIQEKWGKIEEKISSIEFRSAVYFTFENQAKELIEIINESKRKTTFSENYLIEIKGDKPTVIQDLKSYSIQGILTSKITENENEKKEKKEKNPTIIISTTFDSFSAAPSLAKGKSNTGINIIIELSRIFSQLYQIQETTSVFDLMFVINGAGSNFNYHGSKKWLNSLDKRFLDSVQFVLSIDSIFESTLSDSPQKLFFHVADSSLENKELQNFYEFLKYSCKQMNIQIELIKTQIDKNNPVISWEHELFTRKHIPSATLSSIKNPESKLHTGSIISNTREIKPELISTTTNIILSSLSHLIYQTGEKLKIDSEKENQENDPQEYSLFDQKYQPNLLLIDLFQQSISQYPKFIPFMNEDDQFLQIIQNSFDQFGLESKKETFPINLKIKTKYFKTSQAILNILTVKSKLFDLFILLIGVVYVAGVYVAFTGYRLIKDKLKRFFNKKKKKQND